MSQSRISSSSDNESLADNESISCDESISVRHQSIAYQQYVIEQQQNQLNSRYPLSQNQSRKDMYSPAFQNGKEATLLPSVTQCVPQAYMESNLMYRTYSYIPQYSSPMKNYMPNQQDFASMSTSIKQPDFVSVRYYAAPMSQPTPRLIKGEALNTLKGYDPSSRPKLPIPNIQFSPNGPAEPTFSFHSNYNFNHQKVFPQTSSYRMLNFDPSQLQQQQQQQQVLFKRPELSQKIEHNQSFSKPSSMWNMTGGEQNINGSQKYLAGYTLDNNKSFGNKNFFTSDQNDEKKI